MIPKHFLVPALLGALLVVAPSVASAVGEPSPTASPIALEGGLLIQDLKIGDGREAKPGDKVSVHYTGWLAVLAHPGCAPAGGRKFDSSYDRGKPFDFKLGAGQVIKGWDKGIVGMRAGGRRLLTIPPALAYGDKGVPEVIPPNATLSFDVELLDVE